MPDKVFTLFQLIGKTKLFRGAFTSRERADKESMRIANDRRMTTKFKIEEVEIDAPYGE